MKKLAIAGWVAAAAALCLVIYSGSAAPPQVASPQPTAAPMQDFYRQYYGSVAPKGVTTEPMGKNIAPEPLPTVAVPSMYQRVEPMAPRR